MEGFILSFISDICRDGWIKGWIDGAREKDGWRDLFNHLFLISIQGWVDKRMDRWNKGGGWMEGFIHSFISDICRDGWIIGWMDGWSKEGMDGGIY